MLRNGRAVYPGTAENRLVKIFKKFIATHIFCNDSHTNSCNTLFFQEGLIMANNCKDYENNSQNNSQNKGMNNSQNKSQNNSQNSSQNKSQNSSQNKSQNNY